MTFPVKSLSGLGMVLLAVWTLAACAPRETARTYQGKTMGTSWSVKLVALPEQVPVDLNARIQAELDRVEDAMSNWRADSEVSRFNQMGVGCMLVSKATEKVASAALDISRASEGYFDPTVAPLIELWGFGVAEQAPQAPDADKLAAALANTGYRQYSVTERQLCKARADLHLNFSAIAKGYAVDLVGDLLRRQGIERFLVEVGGELYGLGNNAGDEPWSVGIEVPAYGWSGEVYSVLPLNGQAVATSGDYRNYYVVNGEHFSHILNPRTGRPVGHKAASITVLHERAMNADGWATALLAAGPEAGMRLANAHEIAALMILRDGQGFTSVTSEHWPQASGDKQ